MCYDCFHKRRISVFWLLEKIRMKFGEFLGNTTHVLCLLPVLSILIVFTVLTFSLWQSSAQVQVVKKPVQGVWTTKRQKKIKTLGISKKRAFKWKWFRPTTGFLCFLVRLQGWAVSYVTVWQRTALVLELHSSSGFWHSLDHLPSVLSGPQTSYSACLLAKLGLSVQY